MQKLLGAFSFIWLVVTISLASSAELDKRYDDYETMHKGTKYGSLFFNEGATTVLESRAQAKFVMIDGNGELNLPGQGGYCFVFNHYDQMKGFKSIIQNYRAKIIKRSDDGKSRTETFRSTYIPTADETSDGLPDLCIEGIQNIVGIEIGFSASDGTFFSRNISFTVKPSP